ncbi:unnamed protein product [Fraxinus pennsylvanica]|uniref:Uncharacterized protein n=1 Tax=Fraxinus pennsylvanica TaxID=56036 RepID=A0AAD2A816_9LAMI|nr:unnamed protein product [Fraxinus pennsylvanica]
MESLLCNEVWFMSPTTTVHHNVQANDQYYNVRRSEYSTTSCFYSTREDCEKAIGIFLEKEAGYMPKMGYLKQIESDNLIDHARFKAICWLIKGWKYWMFELLSIACLSVASKFNESITAPLHEFQVEGLDHSFSSSQIQRMELTLLKALGWQMDSPTPYSYIELLIRTINTLNKTLVDNLTVRVTQLLLNTLLDSKFLEFGPCVIAISAVRCILENDTSLDHFDTFISQDQREEVNKCQSWMEKELSTDYSYIFQNANYSSPESPVTVLKVEWDKIYDCQLDLFLLKKPWMNFNFRSNSKRKREEQECAL